MDPVVPLRSILDFVFTPRYSPTFRIVYHIVELLVCVLFPLDLARRYSAIWTLDFDILLLMILCKYT
jgi:hypothetical protein